MSTTTVYVSQARAIARAELRAQQRAAREAARRAKAIAEQEARYTRLVERRDGLTAELPDLVFAPEAFPRGISEDDARRWVSRQETALDDAIATARKVKAERLLRAEAWQVFHAAKEAMTAEIAVCRTLAAAADAAFQPPPVPAQPAAEADSGRVRAAVDACRAVLADLRRQRDLLERRVQTRTGVRAQAGAAVGAISAAHRVAEAGRQQEKDRSVAARQAIDAALSRHGLKSGELPEGLNGLIEVIVANGLDTLPATDWIGRHQARQTARSRARELAAQPPEVLDDPALGRRWTALSARLDAVVNGVMPWESALELAWQQLHKDAREAANRAYVQAQILAEAQKHGFQLSDADEDGLTVMELDGHDGYWVEVRDQTLPDGSVASVAELRAAEGTDPNRDARATEAACQAMHRMAGDQKTRRTVEEIDRTARVRRSRRPAKRRFTAQM